jgi:voltage-gated potassium channel
MDKNLRNKLVKALAVMLAITLAGTVGFRFLLKDMTVVDSFYLTIVTIATVGYGDFSAQNNRYPGIAGDIGKIFSVLLIIGGVGTFLYPFSIFAEYVVSGQMERNRRRSRMRKLVARLDGHFIVCGGGETGTFILDELEKTRRKAILVEKSRERVDTLHDRFEDLVFVEGDATDEQVLRQAGFGRAAGFIAALPDEKDNLIAVMTADQIRKEVNRPDMRIMSKASRFDKLAPKLIGAGASVVVASGDIAGRRMAAEMFRPSVTTFLDRMLRDRRATMRIEEVTVGRLSSLNGLTLAQSRIPRHCGLLVVSVRKKGSEGFIHNPGPQQKIEEGDVLIVLGSMDDVVKLRDLSKGRRA